MKYHTVIHDAKLVCRFWSRSGKTNIFYGTHFAYVNLGTTGVKFSIDQKSKRFMAQYTERIRRLWRLGASPQPFGVVLVRVEKAQFGKRILGRCTRWGLLQKSVLYTKSFWKVLKDKVTLKNIAAYFKFVQDLGEHSLLNHNLNGFTKARNRMNKIYSSAGEGRFDSHLGNLIYDLRSSSWMAVDVPPNRRR